MSETDGGSWGLHTPPSGGKEDLCQSLVWAKCPGRADPYDPIYHLLVYKEAKLHTLFSSKGPRRPPSPRMLVSKTEAFTSISKSTLSWSTSTTLWNSETFPKIWKGRETWHWGSLRLEGTEDVGSRVWDPLLVWPSLIQLKTSSFCSRTGDRRRKHWDLEITQYQETD